MTPSPEGKGLHLENCISKIEKTSFENHEECGIEQRIVSIPNEK